MNLAESKKQVRELEHYASLSSKLEGMVDEQLKPWLREVGNYLESSLGNYREIVSLQEEGIRKQAQAEGIRVQSANDIAERYALDVQHVEKMFEQDDKKSDRTKRIEYLFGIAANTILSVFSAPFSRKRASDYADCVRSYYSALKSLNQTIKIKKETVKKNQENLCRRQELERKEAEVCSRLVSAGISEKAAEAIVYLLSFLKQNFNLSSFTAKYVKIY